MAIAFTLGVSTADTTGGASATSGSFTPAAGDTLIVFGGLTGTNISTDTFTITDSQNLGWIQLDGAARTTGTFVGVAIAKKPAANSSMTVTITPTSVTLTGSWICVMRASGAEGCYVRQHNGAQGAATTKPTVVLPVAALTGNGVVGAVFNATNPATQTAPASWTEATDVGYATPTAGGEAAFRNSGETNSSIAWGSTSSAWQAVVVELYVSGTCATPSNDQAGQSGAMTSR